VENVSKMLKTCKGAFRWALRLILLVDIGTGAASSDSKHGTNSPRSLPNTCPARSVNCLAGSLPQQCLNNSWPTLVPATESSTENTIGGAQTVSNVVQITVTATLVPDDATTPTTPRSTSLPQAPAHSPIVTSTHSLEVSTSEQVQQSGPTQATDPESEGESPLDNADFLSFEEWKRRNLAKAGQSADRIGNVRAGIGEGQTRRGPGIINNALDSLGEDTEIEIDFGGFVDLPLHTHAGATQQADYWDDGPKRGHSITGGTRPGDPIRPHTRGKDAGKTCKERSNYASFDCAATVLKTNSECKGATSVLVENKESYLLNECSARNKFLIVELCNDILVDTVVLANYEFFSSMFRTFRVSVSDRYPVKLDKWRELGTFEARNSRQVQAFLIESPLIWARYLRIEFLTHFGNEFYCPVSLLRVHGTTMMEEFNHDLKGSRAEDDSDGDTEGPEKDDGKATDVVTAENLNPEWSSSSAKTPDVESAISTQSSVPSPTPHSEPQESLACLSKKRTATAYSSLDLLLRTQMEMMFSSDSSCRSVCKAGEIPEIRKAATSHSMTATSPAIVDQQSQHTIAASTITQINSTAIESGQNLTSQSSSSEAPNSTMIRTEQKSSTELSPSTLQTPSSPVKATPSPVQPSPSNPTTQESFFKSVHKRLQLLESNSTLSLQYIEEQSRILRDAFAKVEKRQLAKTSTFLDTLNMTILDEMRDFRHQYDHLWQSTVLELSSQRAQSQQEIIALGSRLTILADEVVFQKRIAVLQFLLILVCLGLVLFSRSSSSVSAYLELPPVIQHAFNKSSSGPSRYAAHFDTPPASPSSTRPPSRYGYWSRNSPSHGRGPSDVSGISNDEGRTSPDVEYSPPTPRSQHSEDMNRPDASQGGFGQESPDEKPDDRRIRSSHANPRGKRDEERRGRDQANRLRPD